MPCNQHPKGSIPLATSTLEGKLTYCNPLPLPDYPRGNYSAFKDEFGWDTQRKQEFRETADPSVLYYEGKWYLYPSCGMAYVTSDFVTWEHHKIEPYNIGYAPTVAQHGADILLAASGSALYRAPHPLGPFERIGEFATPSGQPLSQYMDPMIFNDEDGQLYMYWGIGAPGIFGARLDSQQPNRLITEPVVLFGYNPDHVWERSGDYNEDPSQSYIEGAWMLKEQGKYFLTYCGPGTQFRSYALGTYVGDTPLGPFRYQAHNPILRNLYGLVRGTGHGCFTRGPNATLWVFYTCLVRREHWFERRIGMDPAGFDDRGQLICATPSHTPQWAPGAVKNPVCGNATGLLPLSSSKDASASSEQRLAIARHILDDVPHTFWEAEEDDRAPWLRIDLRAPFRLEAMRLMWAEPHLNYDEGQPPRPMRYRLMDDKTGEVILDRSTSTEDWLIDYRTFAPVRTSAVRLEILRAEGEPPPAISNLTLFGLSESDGSVNLAVGGETE